MSDNLLGEEFRALSDLPQQELRAEFQGTSHLGAPPNDVPSRHYRMMIELSKLRRKSWKCSAIDCNFINLKQEGSIGKVLLPPEQEDYCVPVKNTLLRLKKQLVELNHSLGFDDSLKNLFEIDACIDELRPFTNTLRFCRKSKTCSHNPQAFTLYRCQYVLRGYSWFLNDLSRLFASFRSLYQSEMPNNYKVEPCWVRGIFNQIDERIKDCDRTNMDIVRRDWAVMIRQFDAMRHQIVVRLQSLEGRHDQLNQERSASHGFILLTKLTRLLMNKIARFTNKDSLLRLKMDQVEQMNYQFEAIRNCFYRLLTTMDQNNLRATVNYFRPLDRVVRCFEDTCSELSLHFNSLGPELGFTLEMLQWCDMFRKSFTIAANSFSS